MTDKDAAEDIELKFEGKPIHRLDGAPAELVANALIALQRMVHLIGMKREGQRFGYKARPNAKVRRSYAVICRAPEHGSHVQPWTVASVSGQQTAAAAAARQELLRALRAFDSGNDATIEQVLPDARQRWFLADAAFGLLPPEDDEIEVSIRLGRGQYSFRADRARAAISRFRAAEPPALEMEEIVGKLKAIDFARAEMTIKPSQGRQVRVLYSLKLEPLLQRNSRKRFRLIGTPEMNGAGDVAGFSKLSQIIEVEPSAPKIESFKAGKSMVRSPIPYGYIIGFDCQYSLFYVRDTELGIDVFTENLADIESEVRSDLDLLWRTYALAADADLTPEAQALKRSLQARFQEVTNAAKA